MEIDIIKEAKNVFDIEIIELEKLKNKLNILVKLGKIERI